MKRHKAVTMQLKGLVALSGRSRKNKVDEFIIYAIMTTFKTAFSLFPFKEKKNTEDISSIALKNYRGMDYEGT